MRPTICVMVTLFAATAILAKTVDEMKNAAARENTEEQNTVDPSKDILNLNKKMGGKGASTSSASNEEQSGKSGANSLEMSESGGSGSDVKRKTKRPSYLPMSSAERRGWRKWHRKCKPCPSDMAKKWNDQTIKWICGGYQRARRSFKSTCMMKFRNCQDGTMFVKIHGNRCKNQTNLEHFFYEYPVADAAVSNSNSGSGSLSSEGDVPTDYDE